MVQSILLLFVAVTLALTIATLALGAVALLASAEEVLQFAKVDLFALRVRAERCLVLAFDPIAHEPAALLNDRHHNRRNSSLYDAVQESRLCVIATRAQ